MDTVRSLQIFQLLRFSFLILIRILLIKTDLPLEELGVYDALLVIGGTFTFFWLSGLLDGLLAAFPKTLPSSQPTFLFNVFLLLQAISLIISGLLYFNQSFWTSLLTNYEGEVLPYFDLMCLFWAINIPTFLVEYLYILQKKSLGIIGFGIYSFGVQAAVLVLPVFLGFPFRYSFVGLVLLASSKYLWLLFLLRRYGAFRVNFAALRPYLNLALPLILYFFVGGVMDYIDRILVSKFFGLSQLVIYESGARELPLVTALVGSVASVLVAEIAKDVQKGLSQIKAQTERLLLPLFGISALLMFVSPFAIPLVFSPEVADAALVFNIYLLILNSRILLPQTVLIGLNDTKIIFYTSFLEVSSNLILSLILMQHFGIFGIALASVVAFMLERLILIFYTFKKYQIPLSQYCNVRLYLTGAITLLLSFFLSFYCFFS